MSTTRQPILKVTDVHTYYGRIEALKGISLEVHEGEIVTLIGSNGAGKSTTLRSINGLNSPREGTIEFQGQPITDKPAHEIVKRGIAQSPEGRRLFPRLAERRTQRAGTLSGGEQQMVAMGRALMSRPKLMLMDEPSMGLAPVLVERSFEIIREVHEAGVAILVVEQNANVSLSIADRGYVLSTGRVVLTGTASELLRDENLRKAYLGR